MATIFIIPIIIVTIVGLSGYLIYRYAMYDFLCKRSVNRTLQKYDIKETPFQIIKEYYKSIGEEISHKEIQSLEKKYRQKEPEQFLTMYDSIRDNYKKQGKK